VTGAAPAVLSLVALTTGKTLGLPWWGWLNLAGLGLFVASFFSWREVARERDEAKAARDRLLRGVQFGLYLETVNLGLDRPAGHVQPTLVLTNSADVPIEYRVTRFSAVVQGRAHPDAATEMANDGGFIHAGRTRMFRHANIAGVDFSQAIDGTIDAEVRYFHPAEEGVTEFSYLFSVAFEYHPATAAVTWAFRAPGERYGGVIANP